MNLSLDKEWYTLKETSEILGISSTIIFNKINNIKSSLINIKESEYKMEKRKYLIHREYINRCMEHISKKEWYSIREACKIIGKSEKWLYRRLNNGSIPESAYQKNNGYKQLIHLSYINEQKQYLANIEKNYFTYKEVSHILGKTIKSISEMAYKGTFKDVISSEVVTYVSKKEIYKYKEMIEDTITTSIIRVELNLSEYQVIQLIKSEPQIIANNIVDGQQFYVKNDGYQKFKEGLVFTIKMASEYLNTTYEIAKMLKEKKHVKYFNVNGLGYRTSKYYLEEYLKQEDIPVEQLAMELDIKQIALYKYVRDGELKTRKHPNDKRHFVHREEAERFKNSLTVIKMKYHGTNIPDDYFNDRIRFFRNNTVFKETLDLYEVWAKRKLDNSNWKNPKHMVTILLNFFESLLSNLYKEIFFYTDDELKNLFKSLLDSHLQSFYLFLNYCKSKRICNYSGDYVWKPKKKNDVEPYTKEEWCDLTLDVLDIEKHFEKAVESKKHAEIWLWTLLHFSLDWRKDDLKKFKPINMDVVGIDGLEWFDNNTFTLEISQNILKTVERSMNGVKASKNKKELVFVIPFIFEMPTALAFTLCELHRRQTDKDEKKLITSSMHTRDLKAFFGMELAEFSNRRCSKTLTTYGWETAVKKGKGALAYWLGGFARSHTHKIDMPNPVTQVYIVTQNTDASIEEMALHAFERGIFGWQVKVMIDALNNQEPLSLDEMTKAITEVNKTYSPMMVDSLSKYAVTRHEQSVSLLKELMTIPKSDLKKKLEEISKLQSPSLLDHSQCLIGMKNCPYMKEVEYNLETPCLGCKNRIDTNYILDIVNVELFTLIDRLKDTPSHDQTVRIKYTYMIRTLSYILMDFKRAYDKYDRGYIRSFIDLDKLKISFQELEQTKFLRIEEEEYA